MIFKGVERPPKIQSLVVNLDDLLPLHKKQLCEGYTIILGYTDDENNGIIQKYKLDTIENQEP